MTQGHAYGYGFLIVANAVLTQLVIELGRGTLPIPQEWAGIVPVLVAGITALTMLLPKAGSPTKPARPRPHG